MNIVKIGDGEILKLFKWKFNIMNFWMVLRILENYYVV